MLDYGLMKRHVVVDGVAQSLRFLNHKTIAYLRRRKSCVDCFDPRGIIELHCQLSQNYILSLETAIDQLQL